jgi:3-deoxy-D-manno-octulosonate 8-phosphate phosphatase (KDO 8-P phosphatase)
LDLAGPGTGKAEQLLQAALHDGAGISLARLGGLKTGLITRRNSETVALRARDLKLEYVYWEL